MSSLAFIFGYSWNSFDEYSRLNDLNPPVFTEDSVDVLLAEKSAVQAGRFELCSYASDAEYEDALRRAIWFTRWKTWYSHRSVLQHRALVDTLQKQRLIAFGSLLRRQPFGILIHGLPGTGKSKAAYELASKLLELTQRPLYQNELIVLNEADQFQSEYRSCHRVVIFDDVASSKLSLESVDPYRKVIDFINNVPRCALNPHLELKGNVRIRPELVILTSNSLDTIPQSQVAPGAALRRFPIKITVPGRDAFQLMEAVDSANSVSGTVGSYNASHSFEEFGSEMSMDQLLDYIKPIFLKHLIDQDSYMSSCVLPPPPSEVRSTWHRIFDSFKARFPRSKPIFVAQSGTEFLKPHPIYKDDVLDKGLLGRSFSFFKEKLQCFADFCEANIGCDSIILRVILYFNSLFNSPVIYAQMASSVYFPQSGTVEAFSDPFLNKVASLFSILEVRSSSTASLDSLSLSDLSHEESLTHSLIPKKDLLRKPQVVQFYTELLEMATSSSMPKVDLNWDCDRYSIALEACKYLILKTSVGRHDGALQCKYFTLGEVPCSSVSIENRMDIMGELLLQSYLDCIRERLSLKLMRRHDNEEDVFSSFIIKKYLKDRPSQRLLCREFSFPSKGNIQCDLLFIDLDTSILYLMEVKDGSPRHVIDQACKHASALHSYLSRSDFNTVCYPLIAYGTESEPVLGSVIGDRVEFLS